MTLAQNYRQAKLERGENGYYIAVARDGVPLRIPVCCWYCRREFKSRNGFKKHWCTHEHIQTLLGPRPPAPDAHDNHQCEGCLRWFPWKSLMIHQGSCYDLRCMRQARSKIIEPQRLSIEDCAPPSTWWYQARAIADRNKCFR